jgi:hypothetical protein
MREGGVRDWVEKRRGDVCREWHEHGAEEDGQVEGVVWFSYPPLKER